MRDSIKLDAVSKAFGRTQALDGLTMTVQEGALHGFLGPNGSGKSTTLRILLGLARPDRGSVRLLGYDPWRHLDLIHDKIAYVPGDVALWPALTGGEVITLLSTLHGRGNAKRRAELIERFRLDPTVRIRAYSKGNRQKVALIAALECDTELLLLDEPTTGLDPLMEAEFRSCIAERRRQGVTMLLSSHMLSEVEALCDSVTIIRDGRAIDSGTLAQFQQLARLVVHAQLPQPGTTPDLGLAHDVVVSGTRLTCSVDRNDLDRFLIALGELGITDLTVSPVTLDELFRRHYAETSRTPVSA